MNLPNKLTTMRMVLVVLLIIWLVIPASWFNVDQIIFSAVNLRYFVAAIVFAIAAITDFFDGFLARKLNLITNYGKFMDPIADKLLVNSLLIVLLVRVESRPDQAIVPLILVLIMIARDTIVDGLRLVAISQSKVLAANIFGKMKTVLQMIAIIMFLLNGWPFTNQISDSAPPIVALIFMYAAAFVSLLSGIIYVMQNRDVLKETKTIEED